MKTIKIFIALLISSLLTSCLTNKPIQSSVSQVSGETNRIYQVSNPAFKKQVSAIGVAVLIGATAGGAAAMNGASPAMSYDAQGNQTPNSMINLGLGAIAGLGIVSLGNYAAGQGNEKAITNEKDFAEWTRKYGNKEGKTYIALPNNRIVPKDAELDWKINKYEDMVTFLQLFPNSKRVEELAKQSVSKISREQLLSLIDRDLKSKDLSQETLLVLKRAYLDKSSTVSQAIEAKNRFPELTAEAEKKATELLASMGDVESFMQAFSDSKYADFVEDKAISFVASMVDALVFRRFFPAPKLMSKLIRQVLKAFTRSLLKDFVNAYQDASEIDLVKKEYINRSENVSNFLYATDLYPNLVGDVEEKSAKMTKTLPDATTFKARFGQDSKFSNDVFSNALRYCNRNEVKSLVNEFHYIDNGLLNEAKSKYIESATTIYEANEAKNLYPDFSSNADKRAADLAINIDTYNQYYNFFPNGIYRVEVENKHRSTIQSEYNQVSSPYQHFVFWRKYKDDTMGSVFAEKSQALFNEAVDNSKDKYYDLFDAYDNKSYRDNQRLLVFYFEMKSSEEYAFFFLEEMKQLIQVNDWIGPWVVGIKDAGTRLNQGVIFATWYKEGTYGDVVGQYSNEVAQFLNKVKAIANQKGYYNIEKFGAEYLGDRNADRKHDNLSQTRSTERASEREREDTEKKAKQTQKDLDDCYDDLEIYAVDNAKPNTGSTLQNKCPNGGCNAYKRKTWTVNNYRIAEDKNSKWWVENEFSWSGPYDTKKEAAQRQWCNKK